MLQLCTARPWSTFTKGSVTLWESSPVELSTGHLRKGGLGCGGTDGAGSLKPRVNPRHN